MFYLSAAKRELRGWRRELRDLKNSHYGLWKLKPLSLIKKHKKETDTQKLSLFLSLCEMSKSDCSHFFSKRTNLSLYETYECEKIRG